MALIPPLMSGDVVPAHQDAELHAVRVVVGSPPIALAAFFFVCRFMLIGLLSVYHSFIYFILLFFL